MPLCVWNALAEQSSSVQEESLAIVISIEGTVKIRSRNNTFLAEEELELYDGDVVMTDRLSQAILLYLGEEILQIPEDKTLKISPELSLPDAGKFSELRNVLSAAYVGIKSSLFPGPMLSSPGASRKWTNLRETEIVDLVMPVSTKVMTQYPHFVWLPLSGVKTYEIVVFDGLGRVVWRHKTSQTELFYPQEAPALLPEEYYFWQVTGVDGQAGERSLLQNVYARCGMGYFTVMSEKEIIKVKQHVKEATQLIGIAQDEMSSLLLGIYYEKNQLYGEAQKGYEMLVTLHPSNPIYKKMLAHLYVKIGRKWVAADILKSL